MITTFLLALIIATPIATPAAPDGKDIFERRCTGCHSLDKDKEGPSLRGVYGRAAASKAPFSYSDALRKLKLTWNAETLEKWLADPDKVAPGTDMNFRVVKPDERTAIIDYLKQLSAK
jgi:cytochrome c